MERAFTVEYEDGFTFIKPKGTISCRVVTCKHYEACTKVNTGILPVAKSIFDQLGLDWQLPGHGTAYKDCGSKRYRGCTHVEDHIQNELGQKTEGKIYVEIYHRNCRRPECPICYEKWAGKEAVKIEHRLKYFWKRGKVIHVTVSPSEKDVLNMPYEKLRRKMYQIAQSRGIKGGSAIWHPFRETDAGTWYFSPHFHILGFGWVKNAKQGYEKDGWIVKNIQDGEKERSVIRTALYQLSHCGIDKKHHPVSWFGVCSYSAAKRSNIVIPKLESKKHICPCCGAELVQLLYCGDPDELPTGEDPFWISPELWFEKEGRGDYG